MLNAIPEEVLEFLTSYWEDRNVKFYEFEFSSGGCINNGGRLSTSTGDFFLKWNSAAKFPGMFEAEMRGINLLKDSGTINVPKAEAVHRGIKYSCLLIEFIEPGPRRSDYFEQLGRDLANLHKTQSNEYGLDHSNYIGSLPQRNLFKADWIEFFIAERIEPMLKRAMDEKRIDRGVLSSFNSLFPKLANHIPIEPPSLLHGDLWSGNCITSRDGKPFLIDPAVYFGHREMDLAFSKLFGGFDHLFYRSYQEEYPLEKGFEQRIDIHNLYPLLVHVNLFGGAYVHQIKTIMRSFT